MDDTQRYEPAASRVAAGLGGGRQSVHESVAARPRILGPVQRLGQRGQGSRAARGETQMHCRISTSAL